MGRQRSPNREKAFRLYERHGGNIKNKEIAEILREDPKTISKWKQLDKWDEKLDKKNNSKKRKKNSSYVKEFEEPEVEKELEQIAESEELSDKHLAFCIAYAKCFNATKAYKKVYECTSTAAAVSGSKLLRDPKIQATIKQLKQNNLNRMLLSEEDIFQKYMNIAFSDISDYIEFGRERTIVAREKNETGATVAIYDYVDYARLKKDAGEADGTIVKEVRMGKYGVSVKLEDRMTALKFLADHMDMATQEQKARIESLNNKVRIENEKMGLEKAKFERDDF